MQAQAKFSNQSAFLIIGAGITPLQLNICHRIDANDLAILRHDAGLLTIQVEPFGADACPITHPAANPENRSLN
jgi:hypothetical protein